MSCKPIIESLVGQRFGRLLVVEAAPKKHTKADRRWLCQCDCGNTKIVGHHVLLAGYCRSCTCLRTELLKARSVTHGQSTTPEYNVWNTIRNRCENPGTKSYSDYGARGIKICSRWRESFTAFIEDMGPRPSPKHCIERVDNDGNYEPGNCKWATRTEQNRNTSRNRFVEMNGQTKTISSWCEDYGIRTNVFYMRLKYGWSVERALTEPVKGK